MICTCTQVCRRKPFHSATFYSCIIITYLSQVRINDLTSSLADQKYPSDKTESGNKGELDCLPHPHTPPIRGAVSWLRLNDSSGQLSICADETLIQLTTYRTVGIFFSPPSSLHLGVTAAVQTRKKLCPQTFAILCLPPVTLMRRLFLGPKVLFNIQKFGLWCYHRFTHINDNKDSDRYKSQYNIK